VSGSALPLSAAGPSPARRREPAGQFDNGSARRHAIDLDRGADPAATAGHEGGAPLDGRSVAADLARDEYQVDRGDCSAMRGYRASLLPPSLTARLRRAAQRSDHQRAPANAYAVAQSAYPIYSVGRGTDRVSTAQREIQGARAWTASDNRSLTARLRKQSGMHFAQLTARRPAPAPAVRTNARSLLLSPRSKRAPRLRIRVRLSHKGGLSASFN